MIILIQRRKYGKRLVLIMITKGKFVNLVFLRLVKDPFTFEKIQVWIFFSLNLIIWLSFFWLPYLFTRDLLPYNSLILNLTLHLEGCWFSIKILVPSLLLGSCWTSNMLCWYCSGIIQPLMRVAWLVQCIQCRGDGRFSGKFPLLIHIGKRYFLRTMIFSL